MSEISSSQASRHSSASNEHYTPIHIIHAARKVMGDIDLDPATTKAANDAWVNAHEHYTKEENGFLRPWLGRVFLNPPGGWCDHEGRQVIKRSGSHGGPCTETGECGKKSGHTHEGCVSSQKAWWDRLTTQWVKGNVKQAVFVCFSIELLQSTQADPRPLALPLWFPICFPKQRVAYVDAHGNPQSSPPHASCIIYLPPGRHFAPDDVHPGRRFLHAFEDLGECTMSSRWCRFREHDPLAKTNGGVRP